MMRQKVISVGILSIIWFLALPFLFTDNVGSPVVLRPAGGIHMLIDVFSPDTINNYFANNDYRVVSLWYVAIDLMVCIALGYLSYRLIKVARNIHARRG